jgi:hypothetical protein
VLDPVRGDVVQERRVVTVARPRAHEPRVGCEQRHDRVDFAAHDRVDRRLEPPIDARVSPRRGLRPAPEAVLVGDQRARPVERQLRAEDLGVGAPRPVRAQQGRHARSALTVRLQHGQRLLLQRRRERRRGPEALRQGADQEGGFVEEAALLGAHGVSLRRGRPNWLADVQASWTGMR